MGRAGAIRGKDLDLRILMLALTNFELDTRVQREAQALVSAGHHVSVIALAGLSTGQGVEVIGVGPVSAVGGGGRASKGRFRWLKRMARWLLLPHHEARIRRSFLRPAAAAAGGLVFDVVHAHDFKTLGLGARLAASRGARLVYDSHECWTGRNHGGRPTPLQDRRDLSRERLLARGAHAVITIGPRLADWLRATQGLRDVRVVRNTFPDLGASSAPSAPRAPAGVVYAGNLHAGRDLHTFAAAARSLGTAVRCVALGPGTPNRELSGLEVLAAVPVDAVDTLYQELGLALVPLEDNCLNHRLALPNKLFHALRAGVPVVAADLPQLRDFVSTEGVGVLYEPGNADSLVGAIRDALSRYSELAEAVRRVRERHLWDVDRGVLLDLYAGIAA